VDLENVVICVRVAIAFDVEFKQMIERKRIARGSSIWKTAEKIIEARLAGRAPAARSLRLCPEEPQLAQLHELLMNDETSIYSDPTFQVSAARAVA
jgi:hypothetical protein